MTLYLICISFGRSSNEIQLCENVESNILTHGAKYLKMVHDVFAKFHTAAINTHNNKVKILWFNYLLLLHYFYITVCCQLHTLHGDSATIQDICGLGRAAGGAAEESTCRTVCHVQLQTLPSALGHEYGSQNQQEPSSQPDKKEITPWRLKALPYSTWL